MSRAFIVKGERKKEWIWSALPLSTKRANFKRLRQHLGSTTEPPFCCCFINKGAIQRVSHYMIGWCLKSRCESSSNWPWSEKSMPLFHHVIFASRVQTVRKNVLTCELIAPKINRLLLSISNISNSNCLKTTIRWIHLFHCRFLCSHDAHLYPPGCLLHPPGKISAVPLPAENRGKCRNTHTLHQRLSHRIIFLPLSPKGRITFWKTWLVHHHTFDHI